jgi:hypothetical protein
MTYHYTPQVLRMLEAHGLQPRHTTPPRLVRDYLNDLYRYELRRLRDGLLRGAFPRSTYASLVDATRERYALLSLPLSLWIIGGKEEQAPGQRC